MSDKQGYDLTIAYRIYPGVSKSPFIHRDNKLKLTEVGIRTIRNSLEGIRAKFLFLLDGCPPEYEKMIRSYFDEGDLVFHQFEKVGNHATFLKQIQLLIEQTYSDIVMFAEDDYVYRKGMLSKAISLLNDRPHVDFVTPFDHLDTYQMPIHTRHRYKVMAAEDLHWRTAASTCLTFLTRKKILARTRGVFESYGSGNWDSSLWFSLTKYNIWNLSAWLSAFREPFILKSLIKSWLKNPGQNLAGRKYELWQPMPSIATHMEQGSLAPGIDWQKVADEEV